MTLPVDHALETFAVVAQFGGSVRTIAGGGEGKLRRLAATAGIGAAGREKFPEQGPEEGKVRAEDTDVGFDDCPQTSLCLGDWEICQRGEGWPA